MMCLNLIISCVFICLKFFRALLDNQFSVNSAHIFCSCALPFLCRYTGFRKTVILDRRELVELLDLLQDGEITWDQFSNAVKEVHKNRMGQPTLRKVMPGRPKEEDYFYANPQECTVPPMGSRIESRAFGI